MKRNLWIGVVTVAVLAVAIGNAGASCLPSKLFSTWNANDGRYYYVNFGDTSGNGANLVGRFWETNNRVSANEGSCTADQWIKDNAYYPGQDLWYLSGDMGALGCMVGCPAGNITVEGGNVAQGNFFAAAIAETPASFPQFDFSTLAVNFVAVDARPAVTSSSRTGSTVNVNFALPNVGAGAYGTADITGQRLFKISSASRPSNNLGTGWVQVGSDFAAGGAPFSDAADCSNTANDVWYGVGVVVNGQAPAFAASLVQVECDPNLADPDGRFKLIDRPTKPGRVKPSKQDR